MNLFSCTRFARLFGLAFAFSAMAGCASMSPEECKTANWVEVGYSDATAGQASSRIQDHREACADSGVQVNFENYLAGFERGLPVYCTATSGFNKAASGYDYPSQCDRVKYPAVGEGFSAGAEVYRLTLSRQELERERERKKRQSIELGDQIQALQSQLNADKKANKANYEQRRRLDTLQELARDLRSEVFDLDARIRDLGVQEDQLKQSFYAKQK